MSTKSLPLCIPDNFFHFILSWGSCGFRRWSSYSPLNLLLLSEMLVASIFIAHSSQNLQVSRLVWPQCNLCYFVKIFQKIQGKLAPQQIFCIHLHTVCSFFILSVQGKDNTYLSSFLWVKWLLYFESFLIKVFNTSFLHTENLFVLLLCFPLMSSWVLSCFFTIQHIWFILYCLMPKILHSVYLQIRFWTRWTMTLYS